LFVGILPVLGLVRGFGVVGSGWWILGGCWKKAGIGFLGSGLLAIKRGGFGRDVCFLSDYFIFLFFFIFFNSIFYLFIFIY
jgi:hypothetical protein